MTSQQAALVHRRNVLGFRIACEEMWGPTGLTQAVAGLPDATRRATAGLIPLDEWIAEEFVVAWFDAVWLGPARKDESQMRAYMSATVLHGFGRVKKVLLGMMTPATIASHAPELWRGEHTTGDLFAEMVGTHRMRATLANHAYVERPLLRLAVAEAFRCVLTLTGAREAVESHPPSGRPLVVTLRWSD